MQDRSTFEELKEGVIDFLLSEQDKDESFTANSAESEDSVEEELSIGKGIRIGSLFAYRGSTPARPKRITRPVYLIGGKLRFCRAVHLIPSNDALTSSSIVHTFRIFWWDLGVRGSLDTSEKREVSGLERNGSN
jgi:hypothetical protein